MEHNKKWKQNKYFTIMKFHCYIFYLKMLTTAVAEHTNAKDIQENLNSCICVESLWYTFYHPFNGGFVDDFCLQLNGMWVE